MTQKRYVCRDAEQNLLVVTQKNLLVVTQKKSACRDAEKTACRDAEKNLLIVTQKKITRPVNTTGRETRLESTCKPDTVARDMHGTP